MGRAKGSKSKRPSRRRRLLDIAAVDEAFEAAFSLMPLTALPSPPTLSVQQQKDEDHRDSIDPASTPSKEVENQDEENFHLQIIQANNYDGLINDANENEEDEIEVCAADMYDVREWLELGNETKDEADEEDDPKKVINSLKHDCVAGSSLRSYTLS